MVDQATELFEVLQLATQFRQLLGANKASGLFALMDVIQVVIRSVWSRLMGILATASGLTADMILAGEAAGP